MVTRSGKRISHTDSPIRVAAPAPGLFSDLVLEANPLSLGLWCASSAPKIRFPKALFRSTAFGESLLRKVASREGHKKLKDMESRPGFPSLGTRLRALLTFETFSWYQTTHALWLRRPSKSRCFPQHRVEASSGFLWRFCKNSLCAPRGPDQKDTWLILPVVICLSQRLSHACLSINNFIL